MANFCTFKMINYDCSTQIEKTGTFVFWLDPTGNLQILGANARFTIQWTNNITGFLYNNGITDMNYIQTLTGFINDTIYNDPSGTIWGRFGVGTGCQ